MIKISPLGLQLLIFDDVYEPAEDSYLLAKWVEKFSKGKSVLDMGTGCGIQAIVAAKAGASHVVGVDLNGNAVENAKLNAKQNNVKCEFFVSDLFSNVKETFDMIVFNPPYLPTSDEEKLKGNINLAFDGGKSGRELLDKFLKEYKNYLNKNGFALVLESSLSGIKGEILENIKIGGEKLAVVMIR